ncbi:cation transporter [Gordoniibacillus kamchatkensis]|uniref:cation transporter n=1 Tax=Gordoniibacillus kamchatkensis TaxID=1590651 RepID=UPI000697198D|nr:cation transporter [Paenibacillus sp. VKM B-2647]
MQTVTLKVQGMSCNHCVMAISGALYKLGVTATVELAAGTVVVQFDPEKLTLDMIRAAIEAQGYGVTGIMVIEGYKPRWKP